MGNTGGGDDGLILLLPFRSEGRRLSLMSRWPFLPVPWSAEDGGEEDDCDREFDI